ncbi:MAG: LPS assembly protein LptD [Candidatus Acidiferrales bacterium]
MPNASDLQPLRRFVLLVALVAGFIALPHAAFGQETTKTPQKPAAKSSAQKSSKGSVAPGAPGSEATLESDQQRQVGNVFYADGHVDLHHQNSRLRADHVEYNDETQEAVARGNVQLDYMTQHVEASDGSYELRTGRGKFHNVRASFVLQRRPLPTLLISPNPLYVEAEEVDRLDENTYEVHNGWLTVCDPKKPTWKFYAPDATIRLQKNVRIENGNFRIETVPVMYLPFATFPAEKQRESGFMIPDPGHSTQKGYVLGEAFYWAPTDWMDATVGGDYFSKRGWSEKGELRMKPWENARFDITYFGVMDRGLEQTDAPPLKEGGHEDHVGFTALLPDGWRAVVDFNQLTSLTFRLAWAETFSQAVNSEVRDTLFLTNNFHGFSVDFAALSYKNFLSASPQSSITLRTAPEARFSSVDQAPFPQLPIYFSFDMFSGAEHKGETVTPFDTPGFITRSEFAPNVTIPLHWGPWLSVTPSFTLRSTYYGEEVADGRLLDRGFFRTTEETSVDVRPPTIERVWGDGETKWKHVIEPDIVYNYVTGVKDFARFIRFDEDETLTDTNEVEYGFTQRFYRRKRGGEAKELVSWRLVQKYFFEQTFGGALVNGQRNVFQTLDSLTPFAFADQPRKYSPLVSDLKVTPGKRFDTQLRIDYDPRRGQMTAIGTLVKWKPYKELSITVAHFSVVNLPTPPFENPPAFDFTPRSNQLRVLVGYGDLTRPGWNVVAGASYDFTASNFQNQVAQVSYNGSCCGLGFEYRRLSFGNIRNETRYGFVLRIANLGSAGNLRRQEKIF